MAIIVAYRWLKGRPGCSPSDRAQPAPPQIPLNYKVSIIVIVIVIIIVIVIVIASSSSSSATLMLIIFWYQQHCWAIGSLLNIVYIDTSWCSIKITAIAARDKWKQWVLAGLRWKILNFKPLSVLSKNPRWANINNIVIFSNFPKVPGQTNLPTLITNMVAAKVRLEDGQPQIEDIFDNSSSTGKQ